MKSPDIRFLAWSIFALALSLPLTAWVWSHGERPIAQTMGMPPPPPVAPLAPPPLQQAAPLYAGVPVDFMDAVAVPSGDGAKVQYTVNRDAWVTVGVAAPNGELVRSLGSFKVQSGATQTVFWDGMDRNGKPAPLRHYVMLIVAQAGDRTAVVKKPIALPTLP